MNKWKTAIIGSMLGIALFFGIEIVKIKLDDPTSTWYWCHVFRICYVE